MEGGSQQHSQCLTAGAMPSPIAADMQDEGNDFPNVPVAHSKKGRKC